MNLTNNAFYLYGSGIFCKALIDELSAQSLAPLAVLDLYNHGSHLNDIAVLDPNSTTLNKNLPVLVTILGYNDIGLFLKQLGFTVIIETKSVFHLYPNALKRLNEDGEFWRVKDLNKKVSLSALNKVKNALSDNYSKVTLEKLLAYRQTPSAETYPWPESYEMYFPDNIPNLYQYDELKVLDCGAFDGDTLREFEARNPSNISKYLAIDISSKNLQSLLSHYNLAPDWLETKQVAIGVPQNSKLIVIENGSSSCIRLVEENNNEFTDNEVSSTTLANLGKDILFNVIKVDIEGADYPALKDSIDYIKKSRPTLALSIYHRPEDLWEIPLLFISLFTDSYEYYIRNEGHWGYETIFYAVPKRNNF